MLSTMSIITTRKPVRAKKCILTSVRYPGEGRKEIVEQSYKKQKRGGRAMHLDSPVMFCQVYLGNRPMSADHRNDFVDAIKRMDMHEINNILLPLKRNVKMQILSSRS